MGSGFRRGMREMGSPTQADRVFAVRSDRACGTSSRFVMAQISPRVCEEWNGSRAEGVGSTTQAGLGEQQSWWCMPVGRTVKCRGCSGPKAEQKGVQ